MTSFRVIVLCTGNSARSQIGEAQLAARGARRAAGVVTAASAGSKPAAVVNPYAVAVLAEHGIPFTARTPRHLDEFATQRFDLAITVCDNARDACPLFSGAAAHVHWGLPDPADAIEPAEAKRAFATAYASLSQRIDALLALPLERMAPEEVTAAATAIHTSCK